MTIALRPGDLCMLDVDFACKLYMQGWPRRFMRAAHDVYNVVEVRMDLPFVFLEECDGRFESGDAVMLYTHAGRVIEHAEHVVPYDDAGFKRILRAEKKMRGRRRHA